MIIEIGELLRLHEDPAQAFPGEVLSNIVALIPDHGMSELLLELPEIWGRALATWLVEAYDNDCAVEEFGGIHNPRGAEQIQGARAWMRTDLKYLEYVINDIPTLLALNRERIFSRNDLMRQLMRMSTRLGPKIVVRELPERLREQFIDWARSHVLPADGSSLRGPGVDEVRDWILGMRPTD